MELNEIALYLEELDQTTIPITVTALGAGQAKYGRTKPWTLRTSDELGNETWYVVKAQNNPQDSLARQYMPYGPFKILTTELICGRLGQLFTPALCPPVAIVSVGADVAFTCTWSDTGEHFAAGPSFGSQLVDGVADSKSGGDSEQISPEMAARLVVFQSWLYGDDPSALISPDGHVVLSIDHGYYLTGSIAWSDPIHTVLTSTIGSRKLCLLSPQWRRRYWKDDSCFRDILDELMDLPEDTIIQQFAGIPKEWGATYDFMAELASFVLARRSTVQLSVQSCWESNR